MSVTQKIWKVRRDGVRQRYRTIVGMETTSRAVSQHVASALRTLDFETFMHLIQTPQVQQHIDLDWATLVGEIDGMFEYYFRSALRYAGVHAKPLINKLFNQPHRTAPDTGESSTAVPTILNAIGDLGFKEYAPRIYREYVERNRPHIHRLVMGRMEDVPYDDWEIVEAAIRAGARLGDRSLRPIAELLTNARNDNSVAHSLAAECISMLWPRIEAIRRLDKYFQVLANGNSRSALYYLRELARLNSTKHAQVIHSLVSDMIDDIAKNRNYGSYDAEAYQLVSKGYPSSLFDTLVKVLTENLQFDHNAIEGLGEMRDPRAIPHLLPYVMNPSKYTTSIRAAALEALAKMRASEYIDEEQANRLLEHYVRAVREIPQSYEYNIYDYVGYIQQMNDPRVLPIIESHLREEWRPSYRTALYTAYAGVGGADAVPFLIQQFDTEPPQVQSAIVRALRRIDTPDARRFLKTVPSKPNTSTLAKLALRLNQP